MVCTVIFLTKDNQVLLGLKKSGLGRGNYVGIGGKVEQGESIKEAAIREFKEEVKIELPPELLEEVAVVNFHFPHIKDGSWDQEVYAFLVEDYSVEPQETEEIKPVWFAIEQLPLDQMWDDAKYWIPQILHGQKLQASLVYDSQLKVNEKEISELL